MPRADESLQIKDRGIVAVGRLQKKYDKLKRVNESIAKKLENYEYVFRMHSGIGSRHQLYLENKELSHKIAELTNRVYEQSLLIKRLTEV